MNAISVFSVNSFLLVITATAAKTKFCCKQCLRLPFAPSKADPADLKHSESNLKYGLLCSWFGVVFFFCKVTSHIRRMSNTFKVLK